MSRTVCLSVCVCVCVCVDLLKQNTLSNAMMMNH